MPARTRTTKELEVRLFLPTYELQPYHRDERLRQLTSGALYPWTWSAVFDCRLDFESEGPKNMPMRSSIQSAPSQLVCEFPVASACRPCLGNLFAAAQVRKSTSAPRGFLVRLRLVDVVKTSAMCALPLLCEIVKEHQSLPCDL